MEQSEDLSTQSRINNFEQCKDMFGEDITTTARLVDVHNKLDLRVRFDIGDEYADTVLKKAFMNNWRSLIEIIES